MRYHTYAVCGFLIAVLTAPALAAVPEPSGMRPLDEAAIAVKDPNGVVLDSITRAGNRLVAVGEHGVIIYSDDNGTSWTQAPDPVSVLLTAVRFANAKDGWAVGQYGIILHTNTGGASWDVQLNGVQADKLTLDAANLLNAQQPNSDAAQMAVRRAGIFMTDGPNKPYLTLLVTDQNNVTAFGAYRLATKTSDGGKTWQDWSLKVGDPLSHHLYDAENVAGKSYIVGEEGHVFVSSDGGITFPEVASPADSTLFCVSGTGDGGVFVAGVAGLAFTSYDNGRTWKPIAFNPGADITAVKVLKSGAVVMAAQDGRAFISFDHTKTFTLVPASIPIEIADFTKDANGDLTFVGIPGTVTVPARVFTKNSQ